MNIFFLKHFFFVCSKKYNYASQGCSASIIESNIKSTNNILKDSKTQYMFGSVKQSVYFVIELCTEIEVEEIELQCFEHFTSRIRSFSIEGSRFYHKDPKWFYFGSFTAEDTKTQTFLVQHSGFVRYIKVSIYSYHGQEKIFSLNSFNVYGRTMIDDFGIKPYGTNEQSHKKDLLLRESEKNENVFKNIYKRIDKIERDLVLIKKQLLNQQEKTQKFLFFTFLFLSIISLFYITKLRSRSRSLYIQFLEIIKDI